MEEGERDGEWKGENMRKDDCNLEEFRRLCGNLVQGKISSTDVDDASEVIYYRNIWTLKLSSYNQGCIPTLGIEFPISAIKSVT